MSYWDEPATKKFLLGCLLLVILNAIAALAWKHWYEGRLGPSHGLPHGLIQRSQGECATSYCLRSSSQRS